ncbi:hypothetical protein DFH08DRAFT_293653 [Mycena albidolilacea]|uniref:C2H2-type domain-containing protein n=1 Tax=Mycena albidolilacea TaxID=1033008 RepID=A0AAD6ZRD0_9AGAR|nr:hypothetical protein DFH08DRAFT_293653 [Mycena albidolilacea]
MSHPIALPPANHQDYITMDPGSYTGENGQFNPASYTRHFLGSPISWRAGSFGAQFVPGQSPTAMLVGSYERSAVKSPPDSSILNAWNVFDRQGELCRNYTCCGFHLADLHALLEHFEEVHIVVKDRNQPPSIQIPFNPQMNPPEPDPPHLQSQTHYSSPFDTDDMDLGLDYDDASPPPPSTAPTSAVPSRAPSPSPSPSSSSRPALNISLNSVGFPGMHTPLSARAAPAPFSAYARYNAEYNSPGAITPQDVAEYSPDPSAIAPALVFATGEELQGDSGSSSSSHPSPTHAHAHAVPAPVPAPLPSTSKPKKRSPPPPSASLPPSRGISPLPTPPLSATTSATTSPAPATILLPHKPFRCPKPNCSKSYKQANGLKYHMTHGSCNFGPAKDLEAVRALLERKRANAAASASSNSTLVAEDDATEESPAPTPGGDQLSQAEMNEVEARVRPFACGVGDCTRRYKNMNGLRYHYQHSGDHGAAGLQALAAGLHPCLSQRQNSNGASVAGAGTTTPGAGGQVNGKAGTGAYAWGSTLLPHIQAVATTSTSAATAKGKTEATPFSPPLSVSTPTATSTSTPPSSNPASATNSAPATPGATATFASAAQPNDYLAQLQRAQFAQYHQWYTQAQNQTQAQAAAQAAAQAQAQAQQQLAQQQVDVQMG